MNFKNKTLSILAIALCFSFAGVQAHAAEVTLSAKQIEFNPESRIVKVSGNMPSQCAAFPHPVLLATKYPGVLVLSFAATQHGDFCMELAGAPFDLAFDIRSLKFNLAEMNLDISGTYKIISADGQFSQIVDFSQSSMNVSYSTYQAVGGIFTRDENGSLVLVVSKDEVYQINSPFIDMEKYLGRTVEVQGHVLKIRTPNVNLGWSQKTPPSVLVTGINTTTY